ncbi:MAG: hypothetical protein AAF393_07210 [Pseudomonadota bacterium]
MSLGTGSRSTYILIADLFSVSFVFFLVFSIGQTPSPMGGLNECDLKAANLQRHVKSHLLPSFEGKKYGPVAITRPGRRGYRYSHSADFTVRGLYFPRQETAFKTLEKTAQSDWMALCRRLPKLSEPKDMKDVRIFVVGKASAEWCGEKLPSIKDGVFALPRRGVLAHRKIARAYAQHSEKDGVFEYDRIEAYEAKSAVKTANLYLAHKRMSSLLLACRQAIVEEFGPTGLLTMSFQVSVEPAFVPLRYMDVCQRKDSDYDGRRLKNAVGTEDARKARTGALHIRLGGC